MSFMNFGEYLARPREPETWLVEDVISVGGMATIYGRPKVGKSWAALGMAIAISQGHTEWLGFPVRAHGSVAYLQLDVSDQLWFEKYCMPIRGFVTNPETLHIVPRDLAPMPFNILGTAGAWLKSAIDSLTPRPKLVIVDTFRRTFFGDENDSGHTSAVLSAIEAAIAPSALLLVAHARKDNPAIPESVLNDARGSSAMTGAVDTIMKLTSGKPSEKGVLLYEGRTDEGRRPLRRHPSGLWVQTESTMDATYHVVSSMPMASQNAQAEALAQRLGISHRTAIRRIQEYQRGRRVS